MLILAFGTFRYFPHMCSLTHPNNNEAILEFLLTYWCRQVSRLQMLYFSDEKTFHISIDLSIETTVKLKGSEPPHEIIKHQHDSPKLKCWCVLTHHRIRVPSILAKEQ